MSLARKVLRTSRRQRELRSAPHVRYWPAVSVRHGAFTPAHVDGVLCWLWMPKPAPQPEETRAQRRARVADILGMSTAHFDERGRL